MLKIFKIWVVLLIWCCFFSFGCKVSPYIQEVKQGNFIDEVMVSKLSLGMPQEQVRFILGEPLVIDPFQPDRWDYVYMSGKIGEVKGEKSFTVFFKDGLLDKVDGDFAIGGSK